MSFSTWRLHPGRDTVLLHPSLQRGLNGAASDGIVDSIADWSSIIHSPYWEVVKITLRQFPFSSLKSSCNIQVRDVCIAFKTCR